jgi:hypothetical protein
MRKALLALAIAATSVTVMAEDAEPTQDFNASAFVGIKSTDFKMTRATAFALTAAQ